jgi:xanthine dehydrogenase YagR molybdenum-binding subunit
MATSAYPSNFRPSSAKAMMTGDGHVRILCGTQDLGTGTYPILTQIAAEALGVDPSSVQVEIADTRLPVAPGSGGSCTATSAGSAVQAAAQALRGHIIGFAQSDPQSPLFNVGNRDIQVTNGVASSKTAPAKSMSYVDILGRYGKKLVEQEAFVQPGIERGSGAPGQLQGGLSTAGKVPAGRNPAYTMYGFGAHFCEVRVDQDLGFIRVARWTSAHALGKILNRKTLESQIRGGIVWGIGMGLLEETLMDPNEGRFVNSNLAEYHVPTNADVPAIDVHLIEEEDRFVSPLGSKGGGEIGICGAAAAIANAVYNATGKRIRELPITLDKLI